MLWAVCLPMIMPTSNLIRYVNCSLLSGTNHGGLTDEVRQITEQWTYLYNAERPHDALGSLSPYDYAHVKSNSLC